MSKFLIVIIMAFSLPSLAFVGSALKLPLENTLLGPVVHKANTHDHTTTFDLVNSRAFPWRAIGQLRAIIDNNRFIACTAFLVSERHILTNGHCVLSEKIKASKTLKYVFYPNLYGVTLRHAGFQATRSLYTAFKHKTSTQPQSGDDYAILELKDPVGKKIGYFGFENSKGERLPSFKGELGFKETVRDSKRCSDTTSAIDLLNEYLKNTGGTDSYFESPIFKDTRQSSCMSGYPNDAAARGFQYYSNQCGIVGIKGRSILHDCPSTPASSGSPMFYKEKVAGDKPQWLVQFLNVGHYGEQYDGAILTENNANIALPVDYFFDAIKKFRK